MVIGALVALFIHRKARLALNVLLVGISTYFLSELGKMLVGRPRPYALLAHVTSRERFISGLGFPSGHTAVTASIALLVWLYVPTRYRWLLPLWIFGVALSRIYLGVHAPLDVVGGVALGAACAYSYILIQPFVVKQLKRILPRKRLETTKE